MQLKKSSFFGGIILLTLGLLSMAWASKSYSIKDKKTLNSELQTIQITVKNINIGWGKASHISIIAKEYPQLTFGMTGITYKAANVNAINDNILIDNKIEIDILKKPYNEEIFRAENIPSLGENIYVGIYGLRENDKAYLTLESINKKHSKSYTFGIYIFSLVGLIIMTFGIRKMYISIIL